MRDMMQSGQTAWLQNLDRTSTNLGDIYLPSSDFSHPVSFVKAGNRLAAGVEIGRSPMDCGKVK